MPWEIDYALLTFTQLKKSKYFLSKEDNITIETVLNLSSYIIDWDNSKLPKQFFIDKYNEISNLLIDYNHIKRIYDGDKIYGHLNLQKECISSEVDYYMGICPDMYFSEHLLAYMIEGAKSIKNEYFVITPQISKVGDNDWDRIVDPKYLDTPYLDYLKVDTFDIRYNNKIDNQERYLEPLHKSKFAGWFDLYSKSFYEELCPVQKEWNGYGPWDYYSMVITDYCKSKGVDVQQYVLRGETIWMYPSGPLLENNTNGFTKYYRDRLKTHNIPNQREEFERNLEMYVNKTLTTLKDKNII